MPKDYKNSGQQRAAAPKKKVVQAPPPPRRSYGFVWGLVIGLAIAGYVYWDKRSDAPVAEPAAAPEKPVAAAKPTPKPEVKPEPPKPEKEQLPPKRESRFAFYRLLNDYELLIPDEEIAVGVPEPASTPAQAAEPPQVKPGKNYMVQVGSFQTSKDAENRRAQMALIGFQTSTQSVEVSPGKTWHRVRIGPQTSDQVKATVATLQSERFEYLITQVRD